MSRTIPFDKQAECDVCHRLGAYDFMGDFVCPACYDKDVDEHYGDSGLVLQDRE